MSDPMLQSIGRVRTMATWIRKTGKPAARYPKLAEMEGIEAEEAKRFAVGMYPWPARWTKKLYAAAVAG